LSGVTWCASALDAARDADATVVLTEWNEFRAIDLEALAAAMRGDVLVDLRNVFPPADAAEAGLKYHSIGRAAVSSSGGSGGDEASARVRGKPKRARRS
jgi:UDPglucose 6-dehydrogenase